MKFKIEKKPVPQIYRKRHWEEFIAVVRKMKPGTEMSVFVPCEPKQKIANLRASLHNCLKEGELRIITSIETGPRRKIGVRVWRAPDRPFIDPSVIANIDLTRSKRTEPFGIIRRPGSIGPRRVQPLHVHAKGKR